jgi:hypothetical protein
VPTLDIEGSIILKFVCKNRNRVVWTGFIWKTNGTVACCCNHSSETSEYTKYTQFLDKPKK